MLTVRQWRQFDAAGRPEAMTIAVNEARVRTSRSPIVMRRPFDPLDLAYRSFAGTATSRPSSSVSMGGIAAVTQVIAQVSRFVGRTADSRCQNHWEL